jgi:hypothetical protein
MVVTVSLAVAFMAHVLTISFGGGTVLQTFMFVQAVASAGGPAVTGVIGWSRFLR